MAWIGFSIAVGIFANRCGRSGGGWALLSLVASPLLGAALLVALGKVEKGDGPVLITGGRIGLEKKNSPVAYTVSAMLLLFVCGSVAISIWAVQQTKDCWRADAPASCPHTATSPPPTPAKAIPMTRSKFESRWRKDQ